MWEELKKEPWESEKRVSRKPWRAEIGEAALETACRDSQALNRA